MTRLRPVEILYIYVFSESPELISFSTLFWIIYFKDIRYNLKKLKIYEYICEDDGVEWCCCYIHYPKAFSIVFCESMILIESIQWCGSGEAKLQSMPYHIIKMAYFIHSGHFDLLLYPSSFAHAQAHSLSHNFNSMSHSLVLITHSHFCADGVENRK